MSLAGTLMTPRIDAKIRSKMLASKYKHKRADFKDILRERFKTKIRANRRSLFEKIRSMDSTDTVQDTLGEYLLHELKDFNQLNYNYQSNMLAVHESDQEMCEPELDYDLELEIMRQIEMELVDEEYNWIMEEFSKEEEELNCMMAEAVVCPVCQRGSLQKSSSEDPMTCTACNLLLSTRLSVKQMGVVLSHHAEEHSRNCSENPVFGLINDFNSSTLVMSCDHCCSMGTFN